MGDTSCMHCGTDMMFCHCDLISNNVSSPAHYASGNIEVIDAIEDWGLDKDYYLGNAVKYIARFGKKDKDNPIEDLRKCIWYIERKINNYEHPAS